MKKLMNKKIKLNFKIPKNLYTKGKDDITIDVFRNGMRQKVGKRNDYILTQVSSKTFRVTMR